MKISRFTFSIFFIPLVCLIISAHGQEVNIDAERPDSTASTKYYTNLNNQFILRPYGSYKSNIVDIRKNDKTLKLRPNGTMSFGIGFNYKFLGLGFSYGAPVSKSSKDKYGTTQRLDLQFSIFSKSVGLDAHLQAYKGYYILNPNDFIDWNENYYPKLPDMRLLTLGVNAFYLFNSNRFSYRAAFVGNQVQNKSAGSIVAGIFGTYDEVSTDNGFIPKEIIDTTDLDFDLKSFQALTIGLSAGYMYTFVIKKGFFISLAAIPGGGYRHYEITDINNKTEIDNQFALQLIGRIAIGYNWKGYFVNFNTIFNVRNYKYKSYEVSLSTEQLKLTFGFRFQTKASKKRNQFY